MPSNLSIKSVYLAKEDIREVDLSPVYLTGFISQGQTFHFRKPLKLIPKMDETQQLLCLRHPGLGIDVYAHTRDALVEALAEEMDVLWRNYALEDGAILTPKALAIKLALLAAIHEGR